MFVDKSFEKAHYITIQNAEYRASLISDVSYTVSLAIPKGDYFYGNVSVTFNLSELPSSGKPLNIDFRGERICGFQINGKAVENGAGDSQQTFKEHQIFLDSSLLMLGKNEVKISILNKYRNDGCGLHSFVDAVDS